MSVVESEWAGRSGGRGPGCRETSSRSAGAARVGPNETTREGEGADHQRGWSAVPSRAQSSTRFRRKHSLAVSGNGNRTLALFPCFPHRWLEGGRAQGGDAGQQPQGDTWVRLAGPTGGSNVLIHQYPFIAAIVGPQSWRSPRLLWGSTDCPRRWTREAQRRTQQGPAPAPQ